jgi:hypothetical protein
MEQSEEAYDKHMRLHTVAQIAGKAGHWTLIRSGSRSWTGLTGGLIK